MLPASANPYCVEKIVALSESATVVACEDIVDERGTKLWAKGKPVSRQLQERLLQRKLKRPIEATLSIESGVDFSDVIAACRQAIDENDVLKRLAGSREALGVLAEHRDLRLPGPLRLLLSAERQSGATSYTQSVFVVALCAGIAARLQLPERDAGVLLLAGLLHDLGEMYINPEYLRSAYRLAPSEWKHVATHPRVGQLLIQELTTLSPAVGLAVLQHHERLNGSGYPNQSKGEAIGRLGALLGIADSVAAIVRRGGAGCAYRAGLALRIVPEEYDRYSAQAMIKALQGAAGIDAADGDEAALGEIGNILARLQAARQAAEKLVADKAGRFSLATAEAVLDVLANLTKAVITTGVSEVSAVTDIGGDPELIAEVCLIVREIGWRLRNLSRNVFLHAEAESPAEIVRLADLIACLDGSGVESVG